MKLDLTDWQNKQYQTRNGSKVRILCVDMISQRGPRVVGLVQHLDFECLERWNPDGKMVGPDVHVANGDYDLINAPTKHEGWINIHKGQLVSPTIWNSRLEADGARNDRTECIKIKWTDGEGLDDTGE